MTTDYRNKLNVYYITFSNRQDVSLKHICEFIRNSMSSNSIWQNIRWFVYVQILRLLTFNRTARKH